MPRIEVVATLQKSVELGWRMTTKMEMDEAEQITAGIIDPNREAIKREIIQFKGCFRMDFPEDFLDSLPMGRLIHILQAARIQQQKHKP